MKQTPLALLTTIAVGLTILIGGLSYAYLFFNHPYMGGFPDVATLAQSATQTILSGTITSESNTGGDYATQLFPFIFLENVVLTFSNGLHPLANLWILQELLPFLYIALFFIIGRNLTGRTIGGLISALIAGLIADTPILFDQAFARFISTFALSFIIYLSFIAFFPKLRLLRSVPAYIMLFILGSATLFYHHHFGPLRLMVLLLALFCIGLFFSRQSSFKKYSARSILAFMIVILFFAVSNAPLLPQGIQLFLPQVLPSRIAEKILGTNNTLSGDSAGGASAPAPASNFFDHLQVPSLLLSDPLLSLITIFGIIGILIYIKKLFQKKTTPYSSTTTFFLLVVPGVVQVVLFLIKSVIPTRHLQEASALLIPFAALFLLYLVGSLPKIIGTTLLVGLFTISAVLWYPRIFTLERALNTSWSNITLLEWARGSMPSHASVLTDPFTFHVLQTSVPYAQNIEHIRGSEVPHLGSRLPEAKNALIKMVDRESLIASLHLLCPDFIIIDTPSTSQFFTLPESEQWRQYPDLLRLVFDAKGLQDQRIVVLQPIPHVCEV